MLLILALGLFQNPWAEANVPKSSMNNMIATVYGMYTTSDPTCQSGLIPTVPVSGSGQALDFVQKPTIGKGKMASPLNCIIVVMQNTVTMSWAPGNYKSVTINGNNSFSDSSCNPGGNTTKTICNNDTPSWPASVLQDVAAAGLTAALTCAATPTGTEVLPLYISTFSLCTHNTLVDGGVQACSKGSTTQSSFQPPGAASSTLGLKLSQVNSGKGNYKIVVNPDGTVGATNATTCGSVSAPLFSFAERTEN